MLFPNFMASTNLGQKKLGQGHFYHCVASPLLLTTLNRRLGTEETSFSSLEIGMLSHSCLIQASNCSVVLGLLCRTFLFMMRQMFSRGERSGLQAAISVPGSFSYVAMMLWLLQNVVWHYLVEECRVFLKEMTSRWSICCSRTWTWFSALMVPFQTCKLPMPQALMQPHTISDAGFWTERW